MGRLIRQDGQYNGHVKNSPEGNGSANTTIGKNQKGQEQNQSLFVERVSSIPFIKDSVDTAQVIANRTSLGRLALSAANSTLNTVTKYSNESKYIQDYYRSYIQPHVERADAFGCRSLDAVEDKVPIITQPTSEIINTVVRPSYQIIGDVKVRIDNTFQTVIYPAHVVVQEANKKLGVAVDNFEGAVDKYLPANESGQGDNIRDGENQIKRVYGVLNKASNRIGQRVSNQVSGIPKSRDDFVKLAETNSYMQTMMAQVNAVQERFTQSITVYSQAAQERIPPSITGRVQQTAAVISQMIVNIQAQFNRLAESLKGLSLNPVPGWLKTKVQFVIDATRGQLETFRFELIYSDRTYSEKVRQLFETVQTQIIALLQTVNSQIGQYSSEKGNHETSAPLQHYGLDTKIKLQ